MRYFRHKKWVLVIKLSHKHAFLRAFFMPNREYGLKLCAEKHLCEKQKNSAGATSDNKSVSYRR
nr:MAG TPA_asm: hypothetical protein [Caudoviricetes sp.]